MWGSLPCGQAEQAEQLEQLRVLEAGYQVLDSCCEFRSLSLLDQVLVARGQNTISGVAFRFKHSVLEVGVL